MMKISELKKRLDPDPGSGRVPEGRRQIQPDRGAGEGEYRSQAVAGGTGQADRHDAVGHCPARGRRSVAVPGHPALLCEATGTTPQVSLVAP